MKGEFVRNWSEILQDVKLTFSLFDRSISWVALGSTLISRMCFSRIWEKPPKSGEPKREDIGGADSIG